MQGMNNVGDIWFWYKEYSLYPPGEKIMEAQQLTEMLRWANINQSLRDLTFEDLTEVLLYAIKNKERPEILLRVYGRWNKLRSRRDKDEILAGGVPQELIGHNCGYGG